jgi:hypothetical protein
MYDIEVPEELQVPGEAPAAREAAVGVESA